MELLTTQPASDSNRTRCDYSGNASESESNNILVQCSGKCPTQRAQREMEKLKGKPKAETGNSNSRCHMAANGNRIAPSPSPSPTGRPNPNPFKRPMNALQKQWYRVLLARRVGFGQRPPQDEKELTYADICHRRYVAAFRRYNERFRWEMAMHEQMQRCAIDAMRVHRTFAITTLWLPLHSKREINSTLETLEKVLTVKERRRLEEILKRGESLRTRR